MGHISIGTVPMSILIPTWAATGYRPIPRQNKTQLQQKTRHQMVFLLIHVNISDISVIQDIRAIIYLEFLSTHSYTLQAQIQEHVDAANDLWLVREKYQSLIIDFDGLETPQIQTVRTEIMNSVDLINRKYPGTDPRSYRKAQKALKEDEEQYFAPGEADRLLPHDQNSH